MAGHTSRRRPVRSEDRAGRLPGRGPDRLPARLALRRWWNAINLTTPLGLVLALGSGCSVRRGPLGLVLATGYRWPFPDGGAFTVGNVVLFRARTVITPQLLAHESRHATQYAWCAGLPFLVLYAAAVGWSLLRTGDTASRNVFERRAGLEAGGYRERPVRWPRRRA
ncbi:hypothetical protein [Citricoccus sp.]|uniref:hypothetical protein n=1 Tax=Citricoccus sp. TaxID=1978372 RepID=UPI00262AE9BA|nr:hypothetical protein [Citricoccus sp.]HRO30255.1 hypothetical protein [Citricoccus sp.]HRO93126.1 hypothetical protein [Citricoccus sp.]